MSERSRATSSVNFETSLTRRDFLKFVALGSGSALLGACMPQAPVIESKPTSVPAASPKPTEAPGATLAPTATNVNVSKSPEPTFTVAAKPTESPKPAVVVTEVPKPTLESSSPTAVASPKPSADIQQKAIEIIRSTAGKPQCFPFVGEDPYPGSRGKASQQKDRGGWVEVEEMIKKGETRVIHTGGLEILNFPDPTQSTLVRVRNDRDLVVAILQGGGTYRLSIDVSGWSGVTLNGTPGENLSEDEKRLLIANRLAESVKGKPNYQLNRVYLLNYTYDSGQMKREQQILDREAIDQWIVNVNPPCT